MAPRVYLIPGFFGFSSIGRMRYFDHVHRALEAAFEPHLVGRSTGGLDARWVRTLNSAGVEGRQDRLGQVRSAVGFGTPHHGAPALRETARR